MQQNIAKTELGRDGLNLVSVEAVSSTPMAMNVDFISATGSNPDIAKADIFKSVSIKENLQLDLKNQSCHYSYYMGGAFSTTKYSNPFKKSTFNKILILVVFGIMPFMFSCKETDPTDLNLVPYQCGNDRWGYRDNATAEQIVECKYNYALEFVEGRAVVALNLKYGFLDGTGREIIPLIYDRCYSFSEGLAAVRLNNKYGFINKAGNVIIQPIYDNFYFDFSKNVTGFREKLVAVKLNDKWGFIDKTGKIVIPFMYEMATYFINGNATVTEKLPNGDRWTICINKQNIRVGVGTCY